jgi:hypothetical protein
MIAFCCSSVSVFMVSGLSCMINRNFIGLAPRVLVVSVVKESELEGRSRHPSGESFQPDHVETVVTAPTC